LLKKSELGYQSDVKGMKAYSIAYRVRIYLNANLSNAGYVIRLLIT